MIARKTKRDMDKIFHSVELSGAQAFALHFIYETSRIKKVYAKDIENFFATRRATSAELLHTLEKNKLVERKKEEKDCRKKEIILTKKSLEKVHFIDEEIEKLEEKLIKNIGEDDLTCFFEILEKIENNL